MKKKGISLIVLIITIVVIIILASIIVMSFENNNPIERAKEAKFKSDVSGFKDELMATHADNEITNTDYVKEDVNVGAGNFSEMKKYIPDITEEYANKLTIKQGKLMYVGENSPSYRKEEAKWANDIGVRENGKIGAVDVAENPDSYYGKRITNYSANGVTDWKIFHSDGKNAYIIASDYVPVSTLPTTSAGHKPANTNSSYPKAAPFNNILSDYTGSANITDEKIKALNNDYFSKGYTSTNMRAVAYMLDTGIWSSFASEKAEYAIGGPTVEMLMASYNKSHNEEYKARASSATGYQISKDGGTNWANSYGGMLITSDSLYVITSQTNALAMWLASPSAADATFVMYVACDGLVTYVNYGYACIGFRPLVCLKSNVLLEADGDGYKIK